MSVTLQTNLAIVEMELENLKQEAQKAVKAQKKTQHDLQDKTKSPAAKREPGRIPDSVLDVGTSLMEQELPNVRFEGMTKTTTNDDLVGTAHAFTAPRSANGESFNHFQADVVGMQNANWRGDGSNQFQPNAAQYGALNTRIFDIACTQPRHQQQAPPSGLVHQPGMSRTSSYAETFVDPASGACKWVSWRKPRPKTT